MKLAALLVAVTMSFTLFAQGLELAEDDVIRIGLLINDNEYSKKLDAKCLEVYRCHNQIFLREISVSDKFSLSGNSMDWDVVEAAVAEFFNHRTFYNGKDKNGMPLSRDQVYIVESLLKMAQRRTEEVITSNAPDYVFIANGSRTDVMVNVCDTDMLYNALAKNNRRGIKRTLKKLSYEKP